MSATLRQYFDLTKPRVIALIVFTALVGMLLAIDGMPTAEEARRGLLGFLGIWLAASSAAAINQLLDARIDARMARTSWRPIVVGQITPAKALLFAVVLAVVSMLILWLWVNPMTALLTFASLIGYAVIYTVFLKRATPQNIVIGGIAGAAPPLLGWSSITAMQGEWDWAHALLLVLIIFVWPPPHFWALAIFRREDYRRAMVPMLPVTHGVAYTRWQILLYTVLLLAVTVLPFAARMSGLFYLGGALVLGLVFVWHAWKLMAPPDELYAMKVFNYSIVYLMALFAFLLVDHWLQPLLQDQHAGHAGHLASSAAPAIQHAPIPTDHVHVEPNVSIPPTDNAAVQQPGTTAGAVGADGQGTTAAAPALHEHGTSTDDSAISPPQPHLFAETPSPDSAVSSTHEAPHLDNAGGIAVVANGITASLPHAVISPGSSMDHSAHAGHGASSVAMGTPAENHSGHAAFAGSAGVLGADHSGHAGHGDSLRGTRAGQ